MDKVIEEKTIATKYKHIFICDHCGAKIGEACEADDGWYETKGDFSFYLKDSAEHCYEYKGALCSECKQKLIDKLDKFTVQISKEFNLEPVPRGYIIVKH